MILYTDKSGSRDHNVEITLSLLEICDVYRLCPFDSNCDRYKFTARVCIKTIFCPTVNISVYIIYLILLLFSD